MRARCRHPGSPTGQRLADTHWSESDCSKWRRRNRAGCSLDAAPRPPPANHCAYGTQHNVGWIWSTHTAIPRPDNHGPNHTLILSSAHRQHRQLLHRTRLQACSPRQRPNLALQCSSGSGQRLTSAPEPKQHPYPAPSRTHAREQACTRPPLVTTEQAIWTTPTQPTARETPLVHSSP